MSQSSSGGILPKIGLTIFAILCIAIFKNFGANALWFEKTGNYWDAFMEQKDGDATIEQIREERWGGPYMVGKMVKEYFDKNNIKDPVILFEPNDYLTNNNIIQFRLAEPIVFYYYTGLKSVWMNSNNVKDANYFASLDQQGLHIVPIHSQEELQQILSKYKQYTPSL
ncbi:hypothetical protein ACTHGU_12175 [Chitinophagaceae bacterium MMS25-I14]